ncbi:uncharacterized protein C8R40DRAFT_1073574 [Lentinula edodes]|uniref:uncharacterized protein n=1 Tax=Lentinula edodes TaxID=5353 RepID=UPI001E8E3EC2|nr:uncharacterized protein C8R40DRAFT_1073574 [Lentinula edodes]KAH7870123.1 hypothetical protein C8R40DRAFT_1073574 [Lentinula edodes]
MAMLYGNDPGYHYPINASLVHAGGCWESEGGRGRGDVELGVDREESSRGGVSRGLEPEYRTRILGLPCVLLPGWGVYSWIEDSVRGDDVEWRKGWRGEYVAYLRISIIACSIACSVLTIHLRRHPSNGTSRPDTYTICLPALARRSAGGAGKQGGDPGTCRKAFIVHKELSKKRFRRVGIIGYALTCYDDNDVADTTRRETTRPERCWKPAPLQMSVIWILLEDAT